MVDHRGAVGDRGPLPANARGLRVHQRIRDRAALARFPRTTALRRNHRNHEGFDGPFNGILTGPNLTCPHYQLTYQPISHLEALTGRDSMEVVNLREPKMAD